MTNLFGGVHRPGVGTTLGSAKRDTPTIANLAQQQYQVAVTAGLDQPARDHRQHRPTRRPTSTCSSTTARRGPASLAGQSADGDSEESVTIANPAAGTWVVLVDGYAVPSGHDDVRLRRRLHQPRLRVGDGHGRERAASGRSRAGPCPGTVTANAAPAAGRVLLGNVQVRTDANVLVGQR